MAPRRPLLFSGQYALAAVTAILLVGSIAFVAWAVFGRSILGERTFSLAAGGVCL